MVDLRRIIGDSVRRQQRTAAAERKRTCVDLDGDLAIRSVGVVDRQTSSADSPSSAPGKLGVEANLSGLIAKTRTKYSRDRVRDFFHWYGHLATASPIRTPETERFGRCKTIRTGS